MTLLVASFSADKVESVHVHAERAWAGGAEAVEIRIDGFTGDVRTLAEYLRGHADRKWIVTCRGHDEGGHSRVPAESRLAILGEATRGTNACVDFEAAAWKEAGINKWGMDRGTNRPPGDMPALILSRHDLSGARPRADDIRAVPGEVDGAVGKLAYSPGHINETFAALDLMRGHGGRAAVAAMGEDGTWTRVLAKKLGSFASYCALSRGSETAPGQLTLAEMVQTYRWTDLDSSTRVFGVLGDPVAHSMGPVLFNAWFAAAGINAVYLPLRVGPGKESVSRFLDSCGERPWLDVGGFSVTRPHKPAARRWAGASADRAASVIGAVNTLVFRGGRVSAFNTDCYAAIDSITDALGCARRELGRMHVDILGTGGAARAVVAGLRELGSETTVYGRSLEKAAALTGSFGCTSAPWETRLQRTGEIVINCTNLGQWPAVDDSPLAVGSLAGCKLVFDLVYNPLATRLLEDAAAAGAVALGGLDMFIRQAAVQFELWTSESPDVKLGRELVADRIVAQTRVSD